MLPRTTDAIGFIEGNKKKESFSKSARTRAKVPRKELYPSENVSTGLAQAAAPKQRYNASSSLAGKPLAERALRPISVNIATPVRLSPARKTGANRIRSGSESKIQSLQPIGSPSSDSSRQLPPPAASLQPFTLNQFHYVDMPAESAEASQLNSQNLKALSNLLKSNQPPNGDGEHRMLENGERDCLFRPSQEGISEKFFSLAPSLSSSQRSACSPDENHMCLEDSLVIESTTLHSTFFNAGITLPGPPCGVGSTLPDKDCAEQSDPSPTSTSARLALTRLETMILKQRRVDFEPVAIESKFEENRPQNEPLAERRPVVAGAPDQSENPPIGNTPTIGKVRCALLESERLMGIKWIHNVDTALTTNPHITPEVRYHASMLFSLYWGSRSPKVPKKELIPDSQSKSARDLSLDREAKKKLKLIAATAMACLTLTVKWHFDFCKPLFTLQLMSFCKTTDFRTFKVTPEDLIIAERAIMFSYPVAGGLWLDSPHAFLEELIHIIPSLRLLSNVPSYLRSQRGRKDNKNSRESKNNQLPKSGVRWDWPKVVHQVERTLAKATMWQEVLAFEPSVLCVVALYISLDGVEAGYHEKIDDADPADISAPSTQPSKQTVLISERKSMEKAEEPLAIPPKDVNETDGPWIWRWIDINDTMDQVCRVTQVSGDDVENCLDWFCQSELF
ncbi:hypothetical protein PCANC_16210 [Puccinia coronata f. sp. avenae]|uniref:Uncharacterized protein n=1 Tax=Puccinia coronata f. sp. avenae TaxID=200324 RepID=A0A2N5UEC1_9BASI|nr:hypothetical protein PCASD_11665 [Puccinia coronata f. sp. avenae]PLW36356.1 hypothetical protein PCANC_16210 [Puccinia coronata f. sp. avenae]